MGTEKTAILVRNRFEHAHQWLDAPVEVRYLRSLHRHIFYVDSEIEVYHDDRELEFIMVQHSIDQYIAVTRWSDFVSCEQIAKKIANFIMTKYGERNIIVTVREDNEHGAKYTYNKETNL